MEGLKYIVLLRQETFEISECYSSEVFDVAREKDAGICGVFATALEAYAFIRTLQEEQKKPRS